MKLKIVKLFNNFWQFCLTWNQIPFIISISRLQALKTKSMPQYFGKNKEEIAKGTCVGDLKYRLLYTIQFIDFPQWKFFTLHGIKLR